jgi:hypothetical protein
MPVAKKAAKKAPARKLPLGSVKTAALMGSLTDAAKKRLAAKAGGLKVPAHMTGAPDEPKQRVLPKGFKLPKNLSEAADAYFQAREARLAAEKAAAGLEDVEGALRDHLLREMPKAHTSTIGGKVCAVELVSKKVPKVEDWSKVYGSIVAGYLEHKKRKTGQEDAAFSLLGKAIGKAAVQEAWEAGRQVPGVAAFPVTTLSTRKL